ncbi:replicative DNA helicase [Clostridiales bacterium]|nr:replicative DNA helicase [Clostridiales bacterium]GFI55809.1 replicative DNA helicase [Clostridiales bacterium]
MNVQLDRKMPFSLEAEQSVLGSILIDPACLDTLTSIISSSDFYLEEHQSIYTAMQGMYLKSKNIDVVTLIDELVKEGIYDTAGGKEYLRLIAETVPTAANVKDYAEIVRSKSTLRALIGACEEVTEAAYTEEEEVERLVEMAESKIYAIAEQKDNKNFVHIKDALLQVYNHLQQLVTNKEETQGMKTGFSGLDRVLVGMAKSDLVLVGARPGMGKTSFAMNVAVSAARRSGKAVCVFSLEMSAEQLVTRLLSSEALVDSYHLRSGELTDEDWQKLAHASSILSDCQILIDDTTGMTVTGMMAKLRRVKNLGLVVIDYLGLMQSEHRNDNRVQEVSEISRNLKLMAKEFQIPVICCAQLSRGPESRTDKRPMLSDLRDSGAIEQDADIVMFLYREEYYKDKENPQNTAEVIVAKNRHGSTGKVEMGWLGQYTKFTTIETDENY